MTDATYPPVVLCICGVSMHDYPKQIAAHENRCHCPDYPASYTSPVAF